jgi:hypothetical protein
MSGSSFIQSLSPAPYEMMYGIQAIGQRRRARLQNQRRLDLIQLSSLHRGHHPAGPVAL